MSNAADSRRCLERIAADLKLENRLRHDAGEFLLRLGAQFGHLYELMQTVYAGRDDIE